MNRLFFALDINDSDKHRIDLWRKQNISLTAKPVNSQNLHITLAFLGIVESRQQQTLTEFCDQHFLPLSSAPEKHVNIHVDRLGLFKKAKVLHLDCQHFPKPLIKLAALLSQQAIALGLYQEVRPYHPHITIFRKAKQPPKIKFPELTLTISSFSLYHSKSTPDGVNYIPLKTWSLVQK